jgi:hypothetical protein
MVQIYELGCVCSHDELLQDLLEVLAVEFERVDGGWHADTYGGTRLDLRSLGPGSYLLRVEDDPDHPKYRSEERSFGKMADLDRWFPSALMKAGIACTRVRESPVPE